MTYNVPSGTLNSTMWINFWLFLVMLVPVCVASLCQIWYRYFEPVWRYLHFCCAMRCISAAYAMMRCLFVCVSVTFVSCVRTNKDIFQIFLLSGSHTILVLPYETLWQYSDWNPLMGVSNVGGVGRNLDSELICLLLMPQQVRCCKHGRGWMMATISQVVTIISLLRVFDHQAPRAIKSPSPWFFTARAIKRALALYTITIDQGLTLRRRQQSRI